MQLLRGKRCSCCVEPVDPRLVVHGSDGALVQTRVQVLASLTQSSIFRIVVENTWIYIILSYAIWPGIAFTIVPITRVLKETKGRVQSPRSTDQEGRHLFRHQLPAARL